MSINVSMCCFWLLVLSLFMLFGRVFFIFSAFYFLKVRQLSAKGQQTSQRQKGQLCQGQEKGKAHTFKSHVILSTA